MRYLTGCRIEYDSNIIERIVAIALFLLSLLCPAVAESQVNTTVVKGWYGGVNGGIPFGFSSFSSFGSDGTGAGYEFGIIGGYRFNRVLSAEINAVWGKTTMSSPKCCVRSGYWLGENCKTYYSPVTGMAGYGYGELKSVANLQQYTAQFNINLLGTIPGMSTAPWSIEVSPKLGLVGGKVKIMTIYGNQDFIKDPVKWHLGLGGNLQVGYTFARIIRVAAYSGITWLSGAKIDGIAKFSHANNFIWENGVRVTCSFELPRIHITGKGDDYGEPDSHKARRMTAEAEAAEK